MPDLSHDPVCDGPLECEADDFDHDFATEFECECDTRPALVLPSVKNELLVLLLLLLWGAIAGDKFWLPKHARAAK